MLKDESVQKIRDRIELAMQTNEIADPTGKLTLPSSKEVYQANIVSLRAIDNGLKVGFNEKGLNMFHAPEGPHVPKAAAVEIYHVPLEELSELRPSASLFSASVCVSMLLQFAIHMTSLVS